MSVECVLLSAAVFPLFLTGIAVANSVSAAQATGAQGIFFGRVTSSAGGRALPGVTITITSQALGGRRVVVITNTKGEYLTPELPLGTYSMRYSLPGHYTLLRETIELPGNRTANGILPPVPTLLAVIRGDRAGPVLAFVDTEAGSIFARLPLGPDPHVVDISASNKFGVVVNTNDSSHKPNADSFSVVDLFSRKEVRRVPTGDGSQPHDLRIVGDKVYFATEGFKSIARYDPARNRIDWTVGVGYNGPHMLAVTRDGNTIVGTNPSSKNISIVSDVLKGPLGWKVTHVPIGGEPEGVDISPDGGEAWVTNEAAGGASIVDLARKRVSQHVDLRTTHANRLRFMAGDRVVLVDRHTAELVVVAASTRQLIKKILMPDSAPISARNRNRAYDVVGESNGTFAYVSVNGPAGRSYIGVVDMVKLELVRRIQTGATADGMALMEPEAGIPQPQ